LVSDLAPDEVAPLPGEIIVPKTTNSAFIGTPLEEHLRTRQIKRLVITGVATNNSVEATVRMGAIWASTRIL